MPRSEYVSTLSRKHNTRYCIVTKQTSQNIEDIQSYIDSLYYRNLGALIQHLPKNIIKTNLMNEDQAELATENVTRVHMMFEGFPIIIYKTTRKISKGEIIGWDYSDVYWEF